MADTRQITYGMGFSMDSAVTDINKVEDGLDNVEQATDRIAIGARATSGALSDLGVVGVDAAREIGAAADNVGDAFGDSFRSALKDNQSLVTSLKSGISGALSFTEKKFVGFKKIFSTGVKEIGNFFKNPIMTIRRHLVDALADAENAEEDIESQSGKTGRALDNMGASGASAGNDIKDAISGAFKAFLGIEAIKGATGAIKDFVSAALGAAMESEAVGKKYDALFSGTTAQDWADNYALATGRTVESIKNFMIDNQKMYEGMGITKDAAVTLSETTVTIGADIANAFSISDTEAMDKLKDAINGDKTALLEFGISLDDQTLKDEAYRQGIQTSMDKWSDAEKSQIALGAIIKQTDEIMGAAATSTDGLTNKTRSLEGIINTFTTTAGQKFAPAFEGIFDQAMGAWDELEPAFSGSVDGIAGALERVMPKIGDAAITTIPSLLSAFDNVVKGIEPLVEPFLALVTDIFTPLITTVSEVAEVILPPLADVFGVVVAAVKPLISPLQRIVHAFLPPLKRLLEGISPIIELVGSALAPIGGFIASIAEGIGKVAGWLIDGVGKVWDFFSGLFGGGQQAQETMEGVGAAVEGVGMAMEETTPEMAVDTTSFVDDISKANVAAETATNDSATAQRKIADQNFMMMGMDATATYGQMTLDAEDAWERMVTAAEDGAKKIVTAFESIGKAAQGVTGANISVTGVDLPKHASGTPSFGGGWTEINERGGEVAFLPSGTAIIPADKSQQLIDGSVSQSNTSTFAPSIQITVQGNADKETNDDLVKRIYEVLRKLKLEGDNDQNTFNAVRFGLT